LLAKATGEFAAARGDAVIPTALVTGEIYVRSNAFANSDVVVRLEERGIRAKLVPCGEFVEYVDFLNTRNGRNDWGDRLSTLVQERIRESAHRVAARVLGGHARVRVADSIEAAKGYVPVTLEGEAVLTVGAALHHWRERMIDAVVNVGPLECMPTKVAESQFFHVAQKEGLPTLTLALNGDPINPETLDNFAFEVRERFRGKHAERAGAT
jgi:predicted nucleotide-binding protein (sugar kinase/HSP70/actin superfamily)